MKDEKFVVNLLSHLKTSSYYKQEETRNVDVLADGNAKPVLVESHDTVYTGICRRGAFNVLLCRNGSWTTQERLSDFSPFGASEIYLKISTYTKAWTDSLQELAEKGRDVSEYKKLSGDLQACGIVYPAESYSKRGFHTEISELLESKSKEFISIYKNVENCMPEIVSSEYLPEACIDAEIETDDDRVVIAFSTLLVEGYDTSIYDEMLAIISQIFGEEQTIWISLDYFQKDGADSPQYVSEVVDTLVKKGFIRMDHEDESGETMDVLFRKDRKIEECIVDVEDEFKYMDIEEDADNFSLDGLEIASNSVEDMYYVEEVSDGFREEDGELYAGISVELKENPELIRFKDAWMHRAKRYNSDIKEVEGKVATVRYYFTMLCDDNLDSDIDEPHISAVGYDKNGKWVEGIYFDRFLKLKELDYVTEQIEKQCLDKFGMTIRELLDKSKEIFEAQAEEE